MKNLIFTTLISLSIASCTSNDSEITTPSVENGTITYTYNGKSYKSEILPQTLDQTKAVAAWGYDDTHDIFTLVFNSGNYNEDRDHPNTHMIMLNYSEKNKVNGFGFFSGGKPVPNKNIKVTITYKEGLQASGTFTSDVVNGTFTKIKKG